ncbi:MAG: hypothetical protein KJO21_06700 [Verrucomicrobiae bacterium]|nr:hypothetical protein [Verrucomicrobiae bacterium]NNJ41826.1 hypothetical protein [Akkermansiaceae bacterium]
MTVLVSKNQSTKGGSVLSGNRWPQVIQAHAAMRIPASIVKTHGKAPRKPSIH